MTGKGVEKRDGVIEALISFFCVFLILDMEVISAPNQGQHVAARGERSHRVNIYHRR